MAQMLVCDVCHGIALKTIRFSFDGTEWEMDVCAHLLNGLTSQVADWIEYARRPGKTPPTVTGRTARPANTLASCDDDQWWSNRDGMTTDEKEAQKRLRRRIREWGWSNGWPDLGELGRIPVDLATAYRQRHRAEPDEDAPEEAPEEDDDEAGEPVKDPSLLPKPRSHHRKKPVASPPHVLAAAK